MVRKCQLKRNKPLIRRNNLGGNSTITGINSVKTAEKLLIYFKIRPIFLNEFPLCAIKYPGCTYYATQVHHTEGRGKHLLNIRTYLSVCPNCHHTAGVNSKKAIEDGFSVSRNKVDNQFIGPQTEIFKKNTVIIKCRIILGIKPINLL